MVTDKQRKQALAAGIKTYRRAKYEFDRAYVDAALRATGGNVSLASQLADKDRKDFHELMKRADITAQEYRE